MVKFTIFLILPIILIIIFFNITVYAVFNEFSFCNNGEDVNISSVIEEDDAENSKVTEYETGIMDLLKNEPFLYADETIEDFFDFLKEKTEEDYKKTVKRLPDTINSLLEITKSQIDIINIIRSIINIEEADSYLTFGSLHYAINGLEEKSYLSNTDKFQLIKEVVYTTKADAGNALRGLPRLVGRLSNIELDNERIVDFVSSIIEKTGFFAGYSFSSLSWLIKKFKDIELSNEKILEFSGFIMDVCGMYSDLTFSELPVLINRFKNQGLDNSENFELLKITTAVINKAGAQADLFYDELSERLKDESLENILTDFQVLIDLDITWIDRFDRMVREEIVRNRLDSSSGIKEPVALVIYPKIDYNRAFSDDDGMLKSIIDVGYRLMYYEIGTVDGMINTMLGIEDFLNEKADLLIVGGHGAKNMISFGGYDPLEITDVSEKREYLTLYNRAELIQMNLDSCLNKSASIILVSCSTGKGRENSFNVANVFALAFLNSMPAHIFAPVEPASFENIEFDEDGRVINVEYQYGDNDISYDAYIFIEKLKELFGEIK